jgi:glycosyltransferase involved in cell wall biosynthesis
VTTPTVSVVIASYNGARTIAETLDSVLAQDYRPLDIVVVDDGSTDDFLQALQPYRDSVRVFSQANAGPAAARNTALQHAQGELVAFVDADDVWLPGKLSAQVRLLEARPEIGAVCTRWQPWHADADGTYRMPTPLRHLTVGDQVEPERCGWRYSHLLLGSELLTSAVMMRREVIDELGPFDPTLRNGEDYDYWLRLSRIRQIARLASVGVLYRQWLGSETGTPKPVNYELRVLENALARWGQEGPDGARVDAQALERRIDRMRLEHGYAHLLRGSADIALKAYLQAARRHPWNVKLWLRAGQAAIRRLGFTRVGLQ